MGMIACRLISIDANYITDESFANARLIRMGSTFSLIAVAVILLPAERDPERFNFRVTNCGDKYPSRNSQ